MHKSNVIPENLLSPVERSENRRMQICPEPSRDYPFARMYVNFETIGYVYMLASKMGGTLYVGVTSDLIKRAANTARE